MDIIRAIRILEEVRIENPNVQEKIVEVIAILVNHVPLQIQWGGEAKVGVEPNE